MKNSDLIPGQLVEFSNSANTRRVRGRFVRWAEELVVIQLVKNPDRHVTVDPEGAALKPCGSSTT